MADRTVKPRLPRGLIDRAAGDVAATDRMLAAIRESYELYGFEAVETPFIEYTDALGKFLPDQDRPNEGVFSFQDDDEQWLSLRYDLTAPLARYVAENFDRLPKPYRSYRCGWVFRNEKPGPGRFRQFMQFDADTVGSASPAADAEICMMAADTLERLGVKRGDYVIKVNNRKVLDGVMEAIGLGGEANAGRRLTVLRAIDKLDRLGPDGVRALLGPGRKDESGDFTKGAGLDENQVAAMVSFLHVSRNLGQIAVVRRFEPDSSRRLVAAALEELAKLVKNSPIGQDGVNELRAIAELVSECSYDDGRIAIDPSVVRGLEYYTGPVFEAELTFEVTGEDGRPVRFGSVGGGGRYDGLVGRFRGESVPATGFSIGVSRLFAALKAVKSPIVEGAAARGPVVVLVLDRDQLPAYQRLVSTLRAAKINAEMYLGEAGMNAQLKYADRRGSVCAVIQGSNEREKGEVAIKDLVAGADLAKNAKTLERDAYLALKERAQVNVAESLLVETVRAILARH
ncbi:MAG: histidine--tRNA ligase [Rhizobiales bacterium]|nr:histidine--tRNA ligase [Hyphomicrobiales bacterium]